LLQKSSASFFGHSSKFWDVSALIPISKNMGLDFRNVSSGKNFSSLSAKLLENDWRLRDTYLMCNPHLYQELKTANILLPHQ
jgi:hypothetical protein